MICILMKYHGHTLQSAVDYVGKLCAETIDTFSDNKKKLPSWGPEIDDMVAQYVQGLQDWIVGHVHFPYIYTVDLTMCILDRSLHWSFQSTRYFGTNGMEVKRHRLVTLLPLEPKEVEVPATRTIVTHKKVSCTPTFLFNEQFINFYFLGFHSFPSLSRTAHPCLFCIYHDGHFHPIHYLRTSFLFQPHLSLFFKNIVVWLHFD